MPLAKARGISVCPVRSPETLFSASRLAELLLTGFDYLDFRVIITEYNRESR